MKPRVFITYPIDSTPDKGNEICRRMETLVKSCGCECFGAGIGGNPIVKDFTLPICKMIIANDLTQCLSCHCTVAITDLETFSVGTWIEVFKAYERGQNIILYVTNSNIIRSVFLSGICTQVVRSDEELRACLNNLKKGFDSENLLKDYYKE